MSDQDQLWKPRRRLRHLKNITLLSFAPEGLPFKRNLHLFYELYHVYGTDETLLFVSDQLPLESCLDWDAICWEEVDWARIPLGKQLLHDPQGSQLRVAVYAAEAELPDTCTAANPDAVVGTSVPRHKTLAASLEAQRYPLSPQTTPAIPIETQCSIDARCIPNRHSAAQEPTENWSVDVSIPTAEQNGSTPPSTSQTSAPTPTTALELRTQGFHRLHTTLDKSDYYSQRRLLKVSLHVYVPEPTVLVTFEPDPTSTELIARVIVSSPTPWVSLHLDLSPSGPAPAVPSAVPHSSYREFGTESPFPTVTSGTSTFLLGCNNSEPACLQPALASDSQASADLDLNPCTSPATLRNESPLKTAGTTSSLPGYPDTSAQASVATSRSVPAPGPTGVGLASATPSAMSAPSSRAGVSLDLAGLPHTPPPGIRQTPDLPPDHSDQAASSALPATRDHPSLAPVPHDSPLRWGNVESWLSGTLDCSRDIAPAPPDREAPEATPHVNGWDRSLPQEPSSPLHALLDELASSGAPASPSSFTFSIGPFAAASATALPVTPCALPASTAASGGPLQQRHARPRRSPSMGSFMLRRGSESHETALLVLEARLDLNDLVFAGAARSDVDPRALPCNWCVVQLTDGWYTPPPPAGTHSSPATMDISPSSRSLPDAAEMQRAASAMWETLPLLPGAPLAGFRNIMSKLLGQDWTASSSSPPQPGSTPPRRPLMASAEDELVAEVARRLRMAGEAGPSGSSSPSPRRSRSQQSVVNERTYDVGDMRAEVRRLSSAVQRLRDAEQRRATLRARVEALLEGRGRSREDCEPLESALLHTLQLKGDAVRLHTRLVHLQDRAHLWHRQLVGKAEELRKRCEALYGRRAALCAAKVEMDGPDGTQELWHRIQGGLVARRNRMVAQLASAYQIGPITELSPLDRRTLDVSLDISWWLGMPSGSGAGGTPSSPPPSSKSPLAHWARSSPSPMTPFLSVAGLSLPPNVALRGLEGFGGQAMPDEEQRVAAALGYVAHVVASLGVYLDVPLRYPLRPAMSHSRILDPAPLQLPLDPRKRSILQTPSTAKGRPSKGRPLRLPTPAHPAADPPTADTSMAGSSSGSGPRDLPLFFEGWGGDRTRFAYAIFLLNKDVEQLLAAHGISSAGPSHVLENLYKLTLAAASALPPQPLMRAS